MARHSQRVRLAQATCVPRPVRVRVPVDVREHLTCAGFRLQPRQTSGLPDGCVVSTLCTQTEQDWRGLGARPPAHRTICAINGYFIYIVIIVPPGLFTPTSGCPGRSVWTGDYTNGWRAGSGGGGAAGNGAPGRHAGWALGEEGAGLSWAQPLTSGGKETCLPAIGSFGLRWRGGWRCLLPGGPYALLSRPIPNSRPSRLGAHASTSKQDPELPAGRPLRLSRPGAASLVPRPRNPDYGGAPGAWRLAGLEPLSDGGRPAIALLPQWGGPHTGS